MFVFRRAPYGTIYAQEALDVMLTGAAFGQETSAAFIDDGVYQLLRGQDSSVLGMKQFTRAFAALDDFEVSEIYVEEESLKSRGLSLGDLLDITRDDDTSMLSAVSAARLAELMQRQDVVLQF